DQLIDRGRAADSATNLHVDRRLAKDLVYDIAVGPAARRRVEVNHMEPTESITPPFAGDRNRIRQPNAFVGVVPTDKWNTRALAQVHCGYGNHEVTSSRKACRKRTPGPELFSGWNCTPTVRSARTTAGNRSSSCVLHARTTERSNGRHT